MDDREELDEGMAVFGCLDRQSNQVAYPTLEGVKTLLQVCWGKVVFVIRGVQCGAVRMILGGLWSAVQVIQGGL